MMTDLECNETQGVYETVHQVFEFNLAALDKIVRPVLDKHDPAERGNREKNKPEHQT
ncbi:MAG: hypothetical protein JO279_02465 [Verrucomicrobia bacterium]|nr:hypothetical protein [Verrucomicrobiota bacterium]MBV8375844.1 hypothetical protein [Verrucomicrobiota bacterium]